MPAAAYPNIVYPVVAVAPNGESLFVYSYFDLTSFLRLVMRRYAFDGNPTGPESAVSAKAHPFLTQNRVSIGSGGHGVVVWLDQEGNSPDKGLWGQRFSTDGTRLGVEFLIDPCSCGATFLLQVAVAPDGSFVVVRDNVAYRYGLDGVRIAGSITLAGVSPIWAGSSNGQILVNSGRVGNLARV